MFVVTPHGFSIEPYRPFLFPGHSVNEFVHAIEEYSIVLSLVLRQALRSLVSPFKKRANRFCAQTTSPCTIAELLQIAGIQILLKLTFNGKGKHRNSKTNRFAHEGKPPAGNARSGSPQVVQKTFA